MEKLPYNLELLDKYLDGSITELELTKLRTQFESTTAFEQEVQLQRAIIEGIKSAGNHKVIHKLNAEIDQELQAENFYEKIVKEQPKKGGIDNLLDEIDDELEAEGFYKKVAEEAKQAETPVVALFPKWAKRIVAAAAAILLISLGIRPFFSKSVNQYLAEAEELEQPKTSKTIQILQATIDEGKMGYAGGITLPQLRLLKAALVNFQAEKYAESALQIDDFLESYPEHETANFYRALCFLKTKEYQQAQNLLAKGYYKEQPDKATYFNALCLLKLGQNDKAILLLNEMVNGTSAYSKMAKKLLLIAN